MDHITDMADSSTQGVHPIEDESRITGRQVLAIRTHLGLDRANFARMIGYQGSDQSVSTQIYRLETGLRDVPVQVGLLCLAVLDGWRPVAVWSEADAEGKIGAKVKRARAAHRAVIRRRRHQVIGK